MRIGLTGASGFTGRYVAQAAASHGIEIHPLRADLTDRTAVQQVVAEAQVDAVIHLAAIAFVGTDDWRSFYDVNQLGTYTLLEALAQHRPGMRVVLASSAQVYGPIASGQIDETSVPQPNNHYAISKYAMELGAQTWQGALDIVVTRPFNYTGIGQEARYLIPKIVSHFQQRKSRIELGNTHVRRDFGDVRSVADAYCRLALSGVPAPLANICTGEAHSIQDIIAILEAQTGHHIEIDVNPAFVRANDVPVLLGDNRTLRTAAPEWSPRTLEDTLTWMLNGPSI